MRPRGLEAARPKLILASFLQSSMSETARPKLIFLNIGVKTLPPPNWALINTISNKNTEYMSRTSPLEVLDFVEDIP